MGDLNSDLSTTGAAFAEKLLGSDNGEESTNVYVAPYGSSNALWGAGVWQRTLDLERRLFGEKVTQLCPLL